MQGRSNEVSVARRSGNRGRKSSARRACPGIVLDFEQCEERTLLSLSVGTNFTAGSFGQSGFIPPDTQGPPGPLNWSKPSTGCSPSIRRPAR